MYIQESGVRKIIAEVEATSWRLRDCIRVRKLAATHRLGRIHRLRMFEEKKAWKPEAGFYRIDTVAEIDAQRFHTSLFSELFYRKLSNPRWPHSYDEYTLEVRVDIERLRMEIVLSQPVPPPQCDSSPRRAPAVDTGSDEDRKRRVIQKRGKDFLLFKPVWIGFCTSVQTWTRRVPLFCFNHRSG